MTTPTLNPENTRRWIDALRSGEYGQTKHRLRGEVGFCCWGVACDVSRLSEWNDDCYIGGFISAPREVLDWIGGDLEDTFVGRLEAMNDDRGRSFPFIARFLEIVLALQARAGEE